MVPCRGAAASPLTAQGGPELRQAECAHQMAKPEILRLILATIVLAVALRLAFGLGVRPEEVYTVVPL